MLTGNGQIVVDKRTPSQDVVLNVETTRPISSGEKRILKTQIADQVKNRVGVTLSDLVFVPKGTFEGKFQKAIAIV
jgi:hypothetical protein